jgi:hypothetical protein
MSQLMIIERERFFEAYNILHQNAHVCEAGSLWVTLFLNQPQTQALNNAGIPTRKAYK